MPPTSKESEQAKRLGNDSKRLRNYLEARKVSNRNIPQTKTSGMLESLLDGKDVKKKAVKRSMHKSQQQRISAKGPATLQKQKSISCSNGSRKKITNAKKTDVSNEGSKSIWAKMQKSRKSASSNQQSARSLDDLLGPSSKSTTVARASKKSSKKMTQPSKPKINTKIDEKKNPQKKETILQLSTIGLKKSGMKRKKSGLPSLTSVPRSNSLKIGINEKIPAQIEIEPMTGKTMEQVESFKDKGEPLSIEAQKKLEHVNMTHMNRSDSDKECHISENLSSPSLPLAEKEASPDNDLKYDSKTTKLPKSSFREEDARKTETQNLLIPSPSFAQMKMREIENKKKEIEFQSMKIDEAKTINKQNQNSEESLDRDEIKKRKVNNDNFVRLNMKNNAGACKGARALKHQNKMKKRRAEWKLRNNRLGVEGDEEDEENRNEVQRIRTSKKISIHTAMDPLNDYLDGKFHSTNKCDEGSRSKKSRTNVSSCPTCARHQRPCKLLVVKKNNGNKGRKFYVCSMPMGEQCDFFQWEDDTVDAVERELLHSSTTTGFIARQVAGHVDRFKTLTVPELKQEAKRRGLKYTGKKQAIIARLSIWVRDQVSSAVGVESAVSLENQINSSDSESEDELMILKGADSYYDSDDISVSSESSHDVAEDVECEESGSGDNKTLPSDPSETSLKCLGEETESSLHVTLYKLFGYKDFREGQEWAIRRCLMKKKSLLVAPTGQGKSLCYALPAAMMSGVCIVVSPLVSLMEDQLRHLPPTIPAATLSGTMSAKKLALIIEDLIQNRLKILFVSPERLTSSAFRRLLRPKYNPEKKCYARQLPPVSLLCVDEAHCLSQWGHNFRVSYLRLKTLISKIDPQSILALTATAGPPVVKDICHTLGIQPPRENESLEQDQETQVLCANRDNIDVAVFYVQNEEERLKRLLQILQGESGKEDDNNKSTEGVLSKGSVIIYVWRQKDSEILTEQLRSYGLEGGIVCYHGGMDAGSRSKSQNQFLRGKARICVATVAFGLGINKPDVRGVIHVCLPPSPEHYLQEIGRAGRDAKPALAISLVQENELPQKVSLCYSDRLDNCQIEVLIKNLTSFIKIALEKQDAVNESPSSKLLNIALPIHSLVKSIDCKEESIFTILSMLEDTNLVDEKLLDIEGIIPDSVTVTLKKRSIEKLGQQEEIISCMKKDSESLNASINDSSTLNGGTASQKGFSAYSFGVYRLSVIGCVQRLGTGAEPRHVFAALHRLEQSGELELAFDSQGTAIHLKLNESGIDYFRLLLEEDNNSVLELASRIQSHFSSQDERRVKKVLSMNKIMRKISALDYKAVKSGESKSNRLILFQDMVNKYFADKNLLENSDIKRGVRGLQEDNHRAKNGINSDVMSLLQDPNLRKKDSRAQFCVEFDGKTFEAYTALVLTKVLHGIPTPKTPILEWYSHPLWGRWKEIEFISLYEYIKTLIV